VWRDGEAGEGVGVGGRESGGEVDGDGKVGWGGVGWEGEGVKRVEELWKGERKRLASFTSTFFVSVLCFLFFGFFFERSYSLSFSFFEKNFLVTTSVLSSCLVSFILAFPHKFFVIIGLRGL
jgi:hypothetical protein